MTPDKRDEALLSARDLLVMRSPLPAIARVLTTKYACTQAEAAEVIAAAQRAISATGSESSAERKALLVAGVESLLERAASLPTTPSSIRAALAAQTLLAKVEGHTRVTAPAEQPAAANLLAGHSAEDHAHYMENGVWPEAPEQKSDPH